MECDTPATLPLWRRLWRPRSERLGKIGLALIIANEIRGRVVAYFVLRAWFGHH
jgi:hypothetical protein